MDVNPQYLKIALSTSAANTFTNLQLGIPIPRFQIQKNKSIVVEILKVYFNLPVKDNNYAAGGESSVAQAQLGTKTLSSIIFQDPSLIAFAEKEYRGAFTAAGSYSSVNMEPYTYDCTDGAGHGILVASENLNLGVNTTNFAAAGSFTVTVMYRFKMVNIEEYVGIVQSQSA